MAPQRRSDLPTILITITIAAALLFAGLYVVNEAAVLADETTGAEGGGSGQFTQTAATFDSAGQWVTLNTGEGNNDSVYTSREYAINLTGAADSYFQSEQSIGLPKGNFTTSVWLSVNAGSKGGETMAAVSVDGRAVIAYNGTGASEWVGWYYNESTRNSYTVRLDANGDLDDLHNLVLRANATHLSMYRNDTDAAHTAFVATNVADAPNTTQNWDGRVEEVRVINASANASQRNALYNDPIAPTLGDETDGRIMFDEPYRSPQRLLYAPGGVTISNGSFANGLAGTQLDAARNILSGSHYEWRVNGPEIKLVSGSAYANYPIVYVDYDYYQAFSPDSFTDSFSDAVGLAGLLFALLIVGYILVVVRSGR